MITCPNGELANELKTLLDNETVNQVGSFITSHLASLRSSTDPSKSLAKYHFENIRITKRFPTDFRRFSFNRELSYSVESMGVGASVDSNVIYSQRSYLPRSINFNLTGEIFGNSFNLFELSGRQENLDHLVEYYFGPKGYFNTGTKQEIYDKIIAQYNYAKEQGVKRLRTRRGIKEELDQFTKTIDDGGSNDVNTDLDLDLSVKLFGSEMFFLSFGENTLSNPKEFITKFFEIFDKSVEQLKSLEHTFENHALLLDAELLYPTSIGFPLKFTAQSTGVFRLESKIEANIKEILRDPKGLKFAVKLVPSTNIEILGKLTIDTYTVVTGLQVTGSIHSSTGATVKFAVLNGGRGFDVTVGSPLKKQELFSFNNDIVFISQERDKPTQETQLKFTSKV